MYKVPDILKRRSVEGRDCCVGHPGPLACPGSRLPARGSLPSGKSGVWILVLWSLSGFTFSGAQCHVCDKWAEDSVSLAGRQGQRYGRKLRPPPAFCTLTRPRPQLFSVPPPSPLDTTREQPPVLKQARPTVPGSGFVLQFAFCSSFFFSSEVFGVISQIQPGGQQNYWVDFLDTFSVMGFTRTLPSVSVLPGRLPP